MRTRNVRRNRRLPKLLSAVAAVGLLAAGYGATASGSSRTQHGSSSAAAPCWSACAVKAGTSAAKLAGKPVTLPKGRTIGMISIVNGLESTELGNRTVKLALSTAGYKVIICDGQGNPTQWVRCGNTLLDQGVNAIFEDAIDPALIRPVITKAKAKGVPIIQMTGLVSPGLNASFYPDEAKAGRVLAKYLVTKLDTLPGTVDMAIADYPLPWAQARTGALKALLAKQNKIKITATSQTDVANLVKGTEKTVTDQLTQDPNLKAFWFVFDDAGSAGGKTIAAQFPGKQFPDKPLVATFHGNLSILDLVRKGAIDVTVDVNWKDSIWVSVDSLFEYWGRNRAFTQTPQPHFPGVGDLYSYTIVTKQNLPPAGQYFKPRVDVPSFFKAKWKAEFGLH